MKLIIEVADSQEAKEVIEKIKDVVQEVEVKVQKKKINRFKNGERVTQQMLNEIKSDLN